MGFHPLCGFSLQKGSRIIAIADLVICILSISFRLVVYDYMEYPHDSEVDGEISEAAHANITGVDIDEDVDMHAMHANATQELLEFARNFSMTVYIVQVVVAFVIFVAYILLEVWLCRTLIGASKNRDGAACKLWFWVRLTVTVFILLLSIFGMATLRYDWADWVLEPLNIYRIYELVVVNEFRKEILATSGRVKLRA